MTGGESYASHHLSNNDYYSVGEKVTGEWMGRGAELLGLEGAVTMEEFDAIRQAVDPSTGEFLRQRKSADRYGTVERNGEEVIEKIQTSRNLYDFTVSAPKALSVQAIEDLRLFEAHRAGVAEMSAEMERLAGARVRKFGANDTRLTSNLVIAAYEHNTSRELDPQIHTHLVAGNLTYDGIEGKWKALQASAIYEHREYLTEVYRNVVARVVMSQGYQVADRFQRGKDNGFGIVGIQESTLEKYSQRTAQRDAAIQDFINQNGRRPSDNEIARLVRETREPKLTEITTEAVKAAQRARLTDDETTTLKGLREVALARGSIYEQAPAATSLKYAREHLFARVSVAKEFELYTEALRHGRGRINLLELKAALQTELASGEMLTARGEVATRESLARERQMVQAINAGINRYEPLGRSLPFVVSDRLRPEQKQAVLAVLDSRDLAFNLCGAAGTGKTVTLQELHRGLREVRRSVVAVAPTASAVEELQKVGFTGAMTIARLLVDPVQQAELRGQVLIIDEAGMVSSQDMADLLALAKMKDARVVFSGDTTQIKSVDEGDALRVLERESNLRRVSLLEVQRQTNAEYKAAVEALRNRPAKGYELLEKMGAIREVDWRFRAQEVCKEYRQAAAMLNAKGKARTVLVVAATHDEINGITHAIRADRKQAGEIGDGYSFVKYNPLNWTEAQKNRTKNYQQGQVLAFHQGVKGVAKKNESLQVVRSDQRHVTARRADGKEVQIKSSHVKAFGVFEKQEIEVSAGDKLLLQANWKEKGKHAFKATNGELVTVGAVKPGAIELQDGRELPADYRQFTYGYAVTAHRSQGKTVDYEVIAADRMPKDLFYVSATRAREGLTVVTSDTSALQESIGVSGDRQSATELARRASAMAQASRYTRHSQTDDFHQYHAQRQSQTHWAQFHQKESVSDHASIRPHSSL